MVPLLYLRSSSEISWPGRALTGLTHGPQARPSNSRPAMQRPAVFREFAKQTIFFV
jgi:hypothetical protein